MDKITISKVPDTTSYITNGTTPVKFNNEQNIVEINDLFHSLHPGQNPLCIFKKGVLYQAVLVRYAFYHYKYVTDVGNPLIPCFPTTEEIKAVSKPLGLSFKTSGYLNPEEIYYLKHLPFRFNNIKSIALKAAGSRPQTEQDNFFNGIDFIEESLNATLEIVENPHVLIENPQFLSDSLKINLGFLSRGTTYYVEIVGIFYYE